MSTPPEHQPVDVDAEGRAWYPDPTGRHAFRAVRFGKWTDLVRDHIAEQPRRDVVGGRLVRGETAAQPEAPQRPALAVTAVGPPARERVAAALELAGWIIVGLAGTYSVQVIITALITGLDGDDVGTFLALVAAGAGTAVTGLLIVAAGRALRYLHDIASSRSDTA
jgi:hypothetical protein